MDNYVITHLHSDFSNGTTNIDSVTKYYLYIDKAKELGMKAIAFTEHGNIYQWVKKKEYCEKNNIKYIHGVECYITATLSEKIRDNYHTCLYARNWEGVKELNKLISKANNRSNCLIIGDKEQFYYVPRISLDDFLNLSDNIIISSACLGGVLAKCNNDSIRQRYLDYFIKNKDRCFLEIQHHLVEDQSLYNKYLYDLHLKYDIPLIVGTDTHALNKEHLEGRSILQKSKKIYFQNEEGWDLTLKTYDELIELYKKQNAVPMDEVIKALENTNKLSDMVETFELDRSHKYPKLYNDSQKVFNKKIIEGIKRRKIDLKDNYKEYKDRVIYEAKTYKHNKAIDYMLLEEDIINYCNKNGIYAGYSRGSVSGSEIAYILGITEMDSIKHNLNFERFMNVERISLADIDTDLPPSRREDVKQYLFNKKGLYCADIITFNTIALKGAIRDVARALDIPLSNVNEICENVEDNEDKYRKEYPELFKYVDLLNGTIVSVGNHPCGIVVSPYPLDEYMGLFSTSKNNYPITQINMKEIDSLNFVKLDLLSLDNIEIINETCKLANIERLTPDNVDDKDEKVWNSILESNLGVFQWESTFAHDYYKKLFSKKTIEKIKSKNPNFSYIDLFSVGNGAIRPAGESYRDALANGEYKDNGHKVLNDFLAPTLSYLVYQEQIIEFLHKFCGYTMGEADIVRRGFSKKLGTEQHIPKIKSGFIKTMKEKYDVSEEESERIIVDFIKVIEDASSYLFSLNHAQAYSYIGYICAYLRYYYPLEFLTVVLNISQGDEEKTSKAIEYAKSKNIKVLPPKFRYSRANYMFDKENNTIYKGISSIKYLNKQVAEELYELRDKQYPNFATLLHDIKTNTSIDFRQLKILTVLNYFSEFGKNKKLLDLVLFYEKRLKNKNLKEETKQKRLLEIIEKESELKDTGMGIKKQIKYEKEYYGYEVTTFDKSPENLYIITEIDTKYTPRLRAYCIKTGDVETWKCKKRDMKNNQFGEFNVLRVKSLTERFKRKKIDGEWIQTDEKEMYLSEWEVVM